MTTVNSTPSRASRNQHRYSKSAAAAASLGAPFAAQNSHSQDLMNLESMPTTSPWSNAELSTPPRTPRSNRTNATEPTSDTGGNTDTAGHRRKNARNKNKSNVQKAPSSATASDLNATTNVPKKGLTRPRSMFSPRNPTATPPRTEYAGPTFHASPAPSSLPIPSFFSKSVPELPDNDCLGTVPAEENSGSSEASPTPDSVHIAPDHHAKESPLDIFFRADRKEKARAVQRNKTEEQKPADSSKHFDELSQYQSAGFMGNLAQDIFSLDLDTKNPADNNMPRTPGPTHALQERQSAFRAHTAPPTMASQKYQTEEQRQAMTQALKDLLSQQPRSAASSSRPNYPYQLDPSPSAPSSYLLNSRIPTQTLSTPSTPSPLSGPQTPQSRNSPQYFGSAHEFTTSTAVQSSIHLQRSSNLRQVTCPDSPKDPGSPTEAKASRLDASTISRNYLNAHILQYEATRTSPLAFKVGVSPSNSAAFDSGAGGPHT
ncbi:MAG: hypothetical protein M1829_005905 [Trizodia sp. TS-e1964]|nr:MAG: hypothetical protein M1829_005905 [Trizodia sp. TS-e1964]